MNAYVDQTGCISCGLCVSMCPQVFVFNEEGKAESFVDPIPAGAEESAQNAANSCPVSVIEIQ
jgi:ferredoxin